MMRILWIRIPNTAWECCKLPRSPGERWNISTLSWTALNHLHNIPDSAEIKRQTQDFRDSAETSSYCTRHRWNMSTLKNLLYKSHQTIFFHNSLLKFEKSCALYPGHTNLDEGREITDKKLSTLSRMPKINPSNTKQTPTIAIFRKVLDSGWF